MFYDNIQIFTREFRKNTNNFYKNPEIYIPGFFLRILKNLNKDLQMSHVDCCKNTEIIYKNFQMSSGFLSK
eukprot:TRINITY_DN7003_c0_g1_i1.p1 TRINITY_DN7003_c0_g1~~TRINITY_DN7003_c0_g1_i1.p1  ORF type:complete len:71 (-),score=5.54 TRINITY_DN7003_c0_g1_i1:342-554(-)